MTPYIYDMKQYVVVKGKYVGSDFEEVFEFDPRQFWAKSKADLKIMLDFLGIKYMDIWIAVDL